jgi:hypothetical protein
MKGAKRRPEKRGLSPFFSKFGHNSLSRLVILQVSPILSAGVPSVARDSLRSVALVVGQCDQVFEVGGGNSDH